MENGDRKLMVGKEGQLRLNQRGGKVTGGVGGVEGGMSGGVNGGCFVLGSVLIRRLPGSEGRAG